MRAIARLSIVIIALLLAGVVVDTARATPRGGLRTGMAPHLPPAIPGARIQSAILVQRSDCTGNIRMLELLHRATIVERLQLAVIWYAGPANDSSEIRQLLPNWTRQIPLQPVPRGALRELAQLGHRGTPMLIVLDQEGRIRFTTQSPRSSREFAGLRNIIEGLTWIEEL